MAYVPPALRSKPKRALDDRRTSTVSHTTRLTVNDIQKHFWPRQELDQPQTDDDLDDKGDPIPRYHYHNHSTLNGTQDNPDLLRYVLLFANANPQWKAQHRIYAKTNLHLLPLHPAQVEQPSSPIMVFGQGRHHNSTFEFLGYHRLVSVQFYEPQTPELAQMLERKFTIADSRGQSKQVERDAQAWKTSFTFRWAEVQMTRDQKANSFLKPPVIAASAPAPKPRQISYHMKGKSVNELLQEMRLGHSISDTASASEALDHEPFAETTQHGHDLDSEESDLNVMLGAADDPSGLSHFTALS